MSTLYQDTAGEPIFVETGGGSALRSHTSYDPHVEAVCHHSGRYLTRREIFPQWIGLLREQHDFPGLPELDREFAAAVHALEHQHLIWSRAGVRGIALMLSGLALLGSIVPVVMRRGQINGVLTTWGTVEFVLVYTLIGAGALAGLGLLAWGTRLLARRDQIYHREASEQPPAIADFPLLHCAYDIVGKERLRIDLGNTRASQAVQAPASELAVRLYPDPTGITALYQQYRQAYAQHEAGAYLHAGSIALQNLRAIDCAALEFDHRLVLRSLVPESLALGTYGEGPLLTFSAPFTVKPNALLSWQDGQRRAPLECVPRLKADDSYTLMLHFRWLGNPAINCRLDECRLANLPPELGAVRSVALGRFDTDRQEVIWRNLMFHRHAHDGGQEQNGDQHSLVLSVTFTNPILNRDALLNQPEIVGTYRCVLDGPVSGMTIAPDCVWNVLGRRAAGEQSPINVEQTSEIEGQLTIDARLLSQEHECVLSQRLCYHSALDHDLVARVVETLVDRCRVDLHRIEQAMPRLDPAGTLRTQLYYWDIAGRQYDLGRLNAVDVHVVVSGYDRMVNSEPGAAHTWIDLRVRSLRDPRDREPELRAASLLDSASRQIQRELGPGIVP